MPGRASPQAALRRGCGRRLPSLALVALGATLCTTPISGVQQQAPLDIAGDWFLTPPARDGLELAPEGPIDLASPWGALELTPIGEIIQLSRIVPLPAGTAEWGVAIGPMAFGSYELRADGRLLGGDGALGGPPQRTRTNYFPVPPELTADGEIELTLSLNLWRWTHQVAGSRRPAVQGFLMGSQREMSLMATEAGSRVRLAALATLLFAVVSLLVGLYHLIFFASRTQERPYLWFGLGCICFAANAWIPSPWSQGALTNFEWVYRLTDASGHLAVFCFVPFLWAIMDLSITRSASIYRYSHLLLAAGVMIGPMGAVVGSTSIRLVWLLLFLVFSVGFLARLAWKGNPDARVLSAGVLLLALAEGGEYLRVTGFALPSFLPQLGFTALLMTMSAALAMRFSRAHAELDSLQLSLTERVEQRTAQLRAVTAEAEAASKAKSSLLLTLSHELREPLKSIVAFASIMKDSAEDVLDPRERDFAARIEGSGRYALRLVSDLLDMSRLETGRLRVESIETDLADLVTGICRDLEPSATARDVELIVDVPDSPLLTMTDPYRLKQVLINLIGNGIKFAPGGTVSTHVVADQGAPIAVEVRDTGVGISGTLIAEITHGLEGNAMTPTPREGAGIGLQIARELCELLDYRLTFSSAPGNGTVARIEMIQSDVP